MTHARLLVLTTLAMVAFAANSVLNRLALADGTIDALSYSGIRLAAGALTLAAILALRGAMRPGDRIAGSWGGAASLAAYATAFSLAYLQLDAGLGALILFASVQIGMLAWAVLKGERPGALEGGGFFLAFLSLALLLRPGTSAPAPFAVVLMVLAGLAWAAYTLIGRGSSQPLRDTAGNFLRCAPLGMVLAAPAVWGNAISPPGWAYAIASGALASGLGYAIWYAVLPALPRSSAAYVQLTVPAIAAIGGVLFIAEPLSLRMILCAGGILGGVALALWGAERRKT
ncbi:DMT family transporter [Roseibaca sp. V10]|uniref:DMT family transporter n=1 Tax=Roseinatronobacter domitianus TaxID=2940293 RepID=A0ABT0M2L5_9RHOB|nr:DMT family transporter [Roseibaca domitiana]MCL1629100.1 DMT family transporter [Roseibaca domitiana]